MTLMVVPNSALTQWAALSALAARVTNYKQMMINLATVNRFG